MMNALGIMQHHDAITGTAKQAVADRYSQLLSDAVASNSLLYAQLVGERATKAGLDASLEWTTCAMTSTTPVDCSLDVSSDKTYMVAAHNPSTVSQSLLRFAAPADGTYTVYSGGDDVQSWDQVPSDLLCYTATADDRKASEYQECELFVKAQAPA